MSHSAEQIAEWLADSQSAVVFTGAGVSTESGIPDFRSPNGIWSRSRPVYYDDFVQSAESRLEYWRQKSESHADFAQAQPNVAHVAFARWEQAGYVSGVVTQNIDGLHQLAGSRKVHELHGTARHISCLDCGWRTDADPLVRQFLETQSVPDCPECGGLLKHATISFGQTLPREVLAESLALSRSANLFLACGSSLVVQPAASLPVIAKESGARLVIITRDETPLDDIADLVVHEPIGETMAAVEQLLARSAEPG